jgi:hypothetical protein
LLHDTSIFDVRLDLPHADDIETKNNMRVMRLPAALIACSPGQYADRSIEMRAALAMITDASDVLSRLLAGGHSKVAGRLAGAFRNIGRDQIADNIVETMRAAGFTVNEGDPFQDTSVTAFAPRETSPYVNRLRMMWEKMRGPILQTFPIPPGISKNVASYLKKIDAIYATDAYNSLSIEGYRVSADLIERVRSPGFLRNVARDGIVLRRSLLWLETLDLKLLAAAVLANRARLTAAAIRQPFQRR